MQSLVTEAFINMKQSTKVTMIGGAILLVALIIAWVSYGYLLPLIIFLALTGNNLELAGKRMKDQELDDMNDIDYIDDTK